MDISMLLAQEGHLLITASTKGKLQQLTDLARQSGNHICAVNPASPLLSELTVAENIALPGMYHFNQTLAQVMSRLKSAVEALALRPLLEARPANLSRRDGLKVQVLRCLVQGSSIVLLTAPRPDDAALVLSALDALDKPMRLWASCLERYAAQFKDLNLKTLAATET